MLCTCAPHSHAYPWILKPEFFFLEAKKKKKKVAPDAFDNFVIKVAIKIIKFGVL